MYLGNKMDQQANQFRQEMQPYLDGAAQTMNRTNEFMDNPVGGMLGGLGDTFKQNPWLLPLLLGGGGAALGQPVSARPRDRVQAVSTALEAEGSGSECRRV